MCTPWGEGRRLEALLLGHGFFLPGVALVIDSRFSRANGETHCDDGAKLWAISNGIVAILAGRVEFAEKGLHRAKRQFRGAAPSTVGQASALLSDALHTAVPRERRKNWQDRCFVLAGVSALDGEVAIIRLESASHFRPIVTIEDQFIGQEHLASDLYAAIRSHGKAAFGDETEKEGLNILSTASEMCGLLAAALDDLARSGVNRTVGGQPQLAYVEAARTRFQAMYALDPNRDEFVKRSASYDEVRPSVSFRERIRLAGYKRR